MSEKPFFVVWKEGSVPCRRHNTYEEAEKEAGRLAVKEGCKFYVLSGVSVVRKNDVIVDHIGGTFNVEK